MKPAMTPQQEYLSSSKKSAFQFYKEFAVGNVSLLQLIYFELTQCCISNLPALPGYGLRSLLYPRLFRECGKRPAFGRGMVLRRPKQIKLGGKFLADDYSVLDVRGDGSISIGDYVSLGRFTTIVAKDGSIELGNGVNIGSYCRIGTQSKLKIGASTLIAAYCYIGPGNHQQGDEGTPLISREMDIKGGVSIGENCWLGTRVTIVDGVTIGEGSIIGAHSFVNSNIPPNVIVAGCPAKVVKQVNSSKPNPS